MRRRLLVLFSLMALPLVARAEPPEAVVRVTLAPSEVSVGELVTLTLEVLCPTWFAKPPRFPLGEVANSITRLPERGARPISRAVDGETWSGVTYNYQIYPLVGATYELGGEAVGVACATPGTIGGEFVDVPVERVSFRAVVPAGSESLDPYLAGLSLTLERTIEGEPDSLAVGDALKVSYVAELDGLPAMFLPPFVQIEELPGVAVYPDQPIVEDGPPARRTESYTFIFEAGGDFVLPGARLDWWNRESGGIESARVDSRMVTVDGLPLQLPGDGERISEPVDWRRVLALSALLLLAWRLLSRIAPRMLTARAEARARRLASEQYFFEVLEKALLGRDRRKAYAALASWIERIAPGYSVTDFAARWGDDSLRQLLETFSRQIYREGVEEVQLKRLARPVASARDRVLEELRREERRILPALNP